LVEKTIEHGSDDEISLVQQEIEVGFPFFLLPSSS